MNKSQHSSKPSQQSEVLEEDQQAMQSVEPRKKTGSLGAGRKRKDAIDYDSMVGKTFGLVNVLNLISDNKYGMRCTCSCRCGKLFTPIARNVFTGMTKSCGCLQKIRASSLNKIHGKSKTRLYSIWKSMKARCYREKATHYKQYGGRGISVCDRWLIGEDGIHPFNCFLADMSDSFSDGLSIDRKNNDGNYSPENCKWSNTTEQAENTQRTIYVIIEGEKIPLTAYCRSAGISPGMIRMRMWRNGINANQAIGLP